MPPTGATCSKRVASHSPTRRRPSARTSRSRRRTSVSRASGAQASYDLCLTIGREMLAPGSLKKGPTMRLPTTRLLAGLMLLPVVVLLAAGCGGSKKAASTTTSAATTPGTTTTAVSSKIAAEVPAKDKSKTLIVAADASYAPNEFIGPDGHTVVGMDPDLAKALAGVMGVKVKVVNATFATIIPGLSSGKYDLGMSSFTDTKARQKVVDFVTYFSAGTAFYVKASG